METREPKIIKLMADYSADPVWNIDPEHPDFGCMWELEDLPLPPETVARLERWAEMYERSNLWDEPRFHWTAADADAFEIEGIRLWFVLRKELAPDYTVTYFSEMLRRHLVNPDELPAEFRARAESGA
jgi:hypothetical protein